MRNVCGTLLVHPKERNCLEESNVNWNIILKMHFKRVSHCALNTSVPGYKQLTDFCEYNSKFSDSIEGDAFF